MNKKRYYNILLCIGSCMGSLSAFGQDTCQMQSTAKLQASTAMFGKSLIFEEDTVLSLLPIQVTDVTITVQRKKVTGCGGGCRGKFTIVNKNSGIPIYNGPYYQEYNLLMEPIEMSAANNKFIPLLEPSQNSIKNSGSIK